MSSENPKIFETLKQMSRSYEATKLYRDMKKSGAIVSDKNLILLKGEKLINIHQNVVSVGG
jgi:hypothetical protein